MKTVKGTLSGVIYPSFLGSARSKRASYWSSALRVRIRCLRREKEGGAMNKDLGPIQTQLVELIWSQVFFAYYSAPNPRQSESSFEPATRICGLDIFRTPSSLLRDYLHVGGDVQLNGTASSWQLPKHARPARIYATFCRASDENPTYFCTSFGYVTLHKVDLPIGSHSFVTYAHRIFPEISAPSQHVKSVKRA